VYNPTKAVLSLGSNVTNAVCDIAAGAMCNVLSGLPVSEIRDKQDEIALKLEEVAHGELTEYGIKVEKMFVREFTECETYNLLGVDMGGE
jgi:hypothetical protein